MLKDKIIQYIRVNQKDDSIILFEEEIDFLKNLQFLENVQFVKKDASTRFEDAYIERCDKETENMIRIESSAFLSERVEYLKKHKNEFIYLESKWFDLVNVDAISLEADDVFGTYDVMLGLKLQKKFEKVLKELLDTSLYGDEAKFDLIFSHEDGLWNLNFALNFVEGFTEEMTIDEAFQLIYRFLFKLNEAVEGK
ncbi:branched-chain amino acid aminotransferase [Neobacillus sp. WH10]|uniref:branched-chain amino acid aminotransferase n=1 Tax=Neobacillus sp. WH10 TaxID=3047873 RepID=UPI0024C1518D|nr:branched-chain amino acid aminotransferase [Neobacillus sp. WH10]WHY75359.1 branched-chain amino acid aminotransferase [Neobacillus sp. WH10]